ncbi:MAG TPA: Hsp20/alpha crystallin family protein [Candidatus Binataceae bacterium]|nr:Hsp20/alpha crystallin family protein [Candidatus Binataceae bacterium]
MASWFKDFDRVFDAFFEDALLSRWRRTVDWQDAMVRDCGSYYEIKLAAVGVEPERLNVELTGSEVMVRDHDGRTLGRFAFATPIDAAAVRARWADGTLLITVPKRQSRRVPVEKSR